MTLHRAYGRSRVFWGDGGRQGKDQCRTGQGHLAVCVDAPTVVNGFDLHVNAAAGSFPAVDLLGRPPWHAAPAGLVGDIDTRLAGQRSLVQDRKSVVEGEGRDAG